MLLRTLYRVIYGDTDCGSVMYYGNYLRLFEIGRTEWIRAKGLPYKEIEEKFGFLLPVVEALVRYRSPAFYDDLLTIETLLSEAKPLKLKFEYRILRKEKLLAEGYTVHVPVGRNLKTKKLPDEVLRLLTQESDILVNP